MAEKVTIRVTITSRWPYSNNGRQSRSNRNCEKPTRTKHIDIRFHCVHEAVQNEIVALQYFPTNDMIADLLTKGLPRQKFECLRRAMGIDSVCNLLN